MRKTRDITSDLGDHYSAGGVNCSLTVTGHKKKSGDDGTVKVNGTQACAGVAMNSDGTQIQPSKSQSGDIANTAENLASAFYDAHNRADKDKVDQKTCLIK